MSKVKNHQSVQKHLGYEKPSAFGKPPSTPNEEASNSLINVSVIRDSYCHANPRCHRPVLAWTNINQDKGGARGCDCRQRDLFWPPRLLNAQFPAPRSSGTTARELELLFTPKLLENQLPSRKWEQRDSDRVNSEADARTGK